MRPATPPLSHNAPWRGALIKWSCYSMISDVLVRLFRSMKPLR